MNTQNHRFRLSANGRFIDHRRTKSQALSRAFHIACAELTDIHIFDSLAPAGQVNRWEVRPWEEFEYVVGVRAANE